MFKQEELARYSTTRNTHTSAVGKQAHGCGAKSPIVCFENWFLSRENKGTERDSEGVGWDMSKSYL